MWKIILLPLVLLTLTRTSPLPSSALSLLAAHPPDGRIVGGQETIITKYPYHIGIRYKSCRECEYKHSCGGSIYSARIIVTAAHCVDGRNVKNFLIVAGTSNRRGSDGAVMRVNEIIMHEKYVPLVYDYDIAIMILPFDLPINNVTIKPIPLASVPAAIGTNAIVTGWGATVEGGSGSDVLMKVVVPIIGIEQCRKYYEDESRITQSMMCAGVPEGGLDSCQGDSGGPLAINSELAGVVSWGDGCAQPGIPGVYANVTFLYDWLESTISSKESHIDFL